MLYKRVLISLQRVKHIADGILLLLVSEFFVSIVLASKELPDFSDGNRKFATEFINWKTVSFNGEKYLKIVK